MGASASVVRAGIMGILMVLGPAFGRRSMALNALAISALLMAVQSPMALVSHHLKGASNLRRRLPALADRDGHPADQRLAAVTRAPHAERSDLPCDRPTCLLIGLWPGARGALTGCRTLVLFAGGYLMVTIAATLATLPILLYDFHNLSPIRSDDGSAITNL